MVFASDAPTRCCSWRIERGLHPLPRTNPRPAESWTSCWDASDASPWQRGVELTVVLMLLLIAVAAVAASFNEAAARIENWFQSPLARMKVAMSLWEEVPEA